MTYNILLVEDNEDIQELNKEFLEETGGYNVRLAMSLTEARECIAESVPDIIVLDIMLPDGSGLDFLKELKQDKDMPVLLLTALSESSDEIKGLRAGGDDYIAKPYDNNVLLARIETNLRRVLKAKAWQEICSVTVNRRRMDIPLPKIMYVETADFRCLIHTTEDTIAVNCPLDELQKQLAFPPFYKCHKSYLVNFRYVKQIDEDFTMENGDVVLIRKRGAREVADAYKAWRAGAEKLSW
jgi:CheY-like chemotaxis protein